MAPFGPDASECSVISLLMNSRSYGCSGAAAPPFVSSPPDLLSPIEKVEPALRVIGGEARFCAGGGRSFAGAGGVNGPGVRGQPPKMIKIARIRFPPPRKHHKNR